MSSPFPVLFASNRFFWFGNPWRLYTTGCCISSVLTLSSWFHRWLWNMEIVFFVVIYFVGFIIFIALWFVQVLNMYFWDLWIIVSNKFKYFTMVFTFVFFSEIETYFRSWPFVQFILEIRLVFWIFQYILLLRHTLHVRLRIIAEIFHFYI